MAVIQYSYNFHKNSPFNFSYPLQESFPSYRSKVLSERLLHYDVFLSVFRKAVEAAREGNLENILNKAFQIQTLLSDEVIENLSRNANLNFILESMKCISQKILVMTVEQEEIEQELNLVSELFQTGAAVIGLKSDKEKREFSDYFSEKIKNACNKALKTALAYEYAQVEYQEYSQQFSKSLIKYTKETFEFCVGLLANEYQISYSTMQKILAFFLKQLKEHLIFSDELKLGLDSFAPDGPNVIFEMVKNNLFLLASQIKVDSLFERVRFPNFSDPESLVKYTFMKKIPIFMVVKNTDGELLPVAYVSREKNYTPFIITKSFVETFDEKTKVVIPLLSIKALSNNKPALKLMELRGFSLCTILRINKVIELKSDDLTEVLAEEQVQSITINDIYFSTLVDEMKQIKKKNGSGFRKSL